MTSVTPPGLGTSVASAGVGTLAAIPAASSVPVGARYFATDVAAEYRSDGTSWFQMFAPYGAAPFSKPWQSGRYYFVPNIAAVTTDNAMGIGTARFMPFWVPVGVNINRIGCEVQAATAAAGDIARSVSDAVLNSTTTITSATLAFVAGDVGKPISGTGIPPNTVIASVTNATTAVMSAAATASASGVSVTLGPAVIRLGIYADDGTGRPGALLLDAGLSGSASSVLSNGFVSAASATVQEVTINLNLPAGPYWVAQVVQGVTTTQPTMRVNSAAGIVPNTDIGTSIPSAAAANVGAAQSSVTNVLPASATFGTSGKSPRVFVKVNAPL